MLKPVSKSEASMYVPPGYASCVVWDCPSKLLYTTVIDEKSLMFLNVLLYDTIIGSVDVMSCV